MALNFYTAVYPTRCVVPRMKDRGFGHISFVSSAAGQFAIWGYSPYSASKFALRGLADAIQMELLPYNISVSVLCPPNTETGVFKSFHATTMPIIMRKMTAVAGIVSPEQVAVSHVNDIENGHYLTTNGLMGWFLGVGTAGASPERSLIQAFAQARTMKTF
ncbi:3-ketodihydrosphingosine reductase domain protein [Ancylostoma caninum]|uniref:3-ketodihydrosphingosine reductase domain protein n=1 Tax=Ancylostoma caninum TaxID=29170 RepID=A0A368G656_ANCCA|nr:3-ketodihydrosphingosine reductase domain protein [Ancylostoma caninum]